MLGDMVLKWVIVSRFCSKSSAKQCTKACLQAMPSLFKNGGIFSYRYFNNDAVVFGLNFLSRIKPVKYNRMHKKCCAVFFLKPRLLLI